MRFVDKDGIVAYLAHPTCLALNAIKEHAHENANATVAASTDSLATKLNALATDSSQQYANDFNAAIATYQNRIDNELFGTWLNTTAITLNSTLVEFYDGIQDGMSVQEPLLKY